MAVSESKIWKLAKKNISRQKRNYLLLNEQQLALEIPSG
jgi:hypothetical protein